MCTILFALDAHPNYPLVVAANRDEFFGRPTKEIHFWEDAPDLLAGRDLQGHGTWMGITRTGRFAAVTNYREMGKEQADAPSRGDLAVNFLNGSMSPQIYAATLEQSGQRYNGFNLIFGTAKDLWYYGNRGGKATKVTAGIHGLSNALLDTAWPKVNDGKQSLSEALTQSMVSHKPLLKTLSNPKTYPDEVLPQTGVPLDWERSLSALCIAGEKYGTRTSSVLTIDRSGKVIFTEQQHPSGITHGIEFDIVKEER